MLKSLGVLIFTCLAMAACASDRPHVLQASSNMQEVVLTQGMATQIEMPDSNRVQSVVVGNPSMLSAEKAGDVVNLIPKTGSGQTNLIIRAVDEDGETQVYQYRVVMP